MTASSDSLRIPDHLSDFRLDQLLAAELTAEDERATRGHLERCTDCSARLAEMTAFRNRFQESPPWRLPVAAPDAGTPRLTVLEGGRAKDPAPSPARSRPSLRSIITAGTALAAAAAAVVAISQRGGSGNDLDTLVTRTKGTSRLGLYIQHKDVVRAGVSGDVVHPGDALQLTYSTAEPGPIYLAVLSRDGAGVGSVYFADGERAAAIQPGQEVSLPHSIVLDDALGKEVLYGLFCAEPVAVEPLRAALEASDAPLEAPAGCTIDRVEIEKRSLTP